MRKKIKCINCGNETKNLKYCSNKCQFEYQWDQYCKKVKENNGFPWLGNSTNGGPERRAKKYLILKRGHKCEICGNTEWMGKPIPLVLDHIDGKGNNWTLNNLRFVCGNCDMQLPTYKGKNKGNATRKARFQLSN